MFLKLAIKSLVNRKGSVFLTLLAMTVSVFVLFAVEHIRTQTKESFSNTVSGVDLIIGSRTGSLNLLLYSVFRIGSPTNNVSWDSYQKIANSSQVKWAVPISLGDSHKGYRVIGTSEEYFEHFSYGKKHSLAFKNGRAFEHILEVVIGSEIAKKLNYSVGDNIVLSHGIADTSFSKHDDMPFTIVGVLEPTGTPVDQTLHVSLESIEAIHLGWQNGVKVPGSSPKDTQLQEMDLQPKSITAFMLGLNSRLATFRIQRQINQYRKEPLSAILPGVALSELWQMMSLLESTLFFVSILVFVAAVLGLSAMLLASIRDRTNEIRLLRVIGASPLYLFFLVELETLLITVCSVLLGLGLVSVSLAMFQDMIVSVFGLHISSNVVSFNVAIFSLCMIATSMLVAAVPSLSAFRRAGKS